MTQILQTKRCLNGKSRSSAFKIGEKQYFSFGLKVAVLDFWSRHTMLCISSFYVLPNAIFLHGFVCAHSLQYRAHFIHKPTKKKTIHKHTHTHSFAIIFYYISMSDARFCQH